MLRNKVPFIFLFAALHLLIIKELSAQTPKLIKTIIVDAGHGGTDVGATGQYENSLRSKEKDVTLAIALKLVDELKKQLPGVKIVPTRTTDIYQKPTEKAKIANEFHGDLFLCIHADSGPLKQGKRQVGTRMVTRYKISFTGKGKKRKKHKTAYEVEEPVYEYFKMPLTRSGTSVWIFAAHKTSDKLKAIMDGDENFEIEADGVDSIESNFDFNSPQGKIIAAIYAKRYQERSDRLAALVNEEVENTGRAALGVNQRRVGIWVLQATNMPAILIETGFINNPEDERYINSEQGQQELAEAITKAVQRYKLQVESINNTAPPPQPVVSKNNPKDPVGKTTPLAFETRPTKDIKTIEVKNNKIEVDIYDDGEIDNDIVSVYFNKQMLVDKKSLTTNPHSITLTIEPGKANELLLFAENLGTISPNTALMIITDGKTRHEVRLSADLKNNALVKFELKNNN
ncbi:MAG: N-acetylmuramoyl-L-alanine amidase [Chitinophagaceae bacterium]|nr:N-acetylmuramoyl-L-alanine amidase [Chitinophagaceae bacterium]MBK9485692.1 N-acetylmuramoyl-L-alanine amidase [Chitinophagaceae bacterium]MBL0201004.1 N-acetylmuramoyl-L-alanine amidase [Chitinophagaceae bacterium]